MEKLRRSTTIASLLLLPLLAACAGSQPRGKVVRLQEQSLAPKAPASTTKEPKLVVQEGQGTLEVPENPDEAAVFHFSLGQAYSLDNDPQRAIEAYRTTLVHDPRSALVRARLAAELVKTGNFAEAKSLCEEALKLDPKYVDSYLLLAGIQVAAKEYEGALTTYRSALKIEPENRDALLYFGVTLAETGKTKEGIAQLEKLVKLKEVAESNIDKAVAYYYLAKVQEQAGQRAGAERALASALKHRPAFGKAAMALADLHQLNKEEAKALSVLTAAFRESHSGELAERLAQIHLTKGDYKSAVLYLETLVEEDPTDENVRLRLALVYWQLKWNGKARQLLSELHQRYPTSNEITYYLGELALEAGDFGEALAYYKQISPDYSKYDQMIFRVVATYRTEKKFQAAEEILLGALEKRPDIVAFYPALAAVYEDQNKLADAKLALERGEALFPEDEAILYYLGFLSDRLGDRTAGLEIMERLIAKNPDNANALNFVGYTLLDQGRDLSRAEKYLSRAVALKPNDAFVLDSYGWLLYRQGKVQAAMKKLEAAFAIRPDEAVIAEHLADVYLALNLPQKARNAYLQARKHSAGDKELTARVEHKLQNLDGLLARGGKEVRPAPLVPGKRAPASVPQP